ncbi:MAG: hypothetical protein IKI83_01090 [Prevotella sp.]|nr:hypothetical protein [Prevotella sp.]
MRRLLVVLTCLLTCLMTGAQNEVEHIHVVIINGGMNRLMNHERYWNDCSFLYQTLRKDYHIPKRNFTLLISDGGEPEKDMLKENGNGFASSPNDLDGDGERDVWLSATFENLKSQLTELSVRLAPQDHLFLFLMDHGDTHDHLNTSYAYLWGAEKLDDTTLASLLDRFRVGTMTIVMGQCYSGGFIDNLERNGRIVISSCAGDELSWSCLDKPYDEFVYHWICAIAGHDEKGNRVNADVNADGFVSMAEAFDYAKLHDRRNETPQYISVPMALGEQWCFLGLVNDGIEEIKTEAQNSHYYSPSGIPLLSTSYGLLIKKEKKIIKKP